MELTLLLDAIRATRTVPDINDLAQRFYCDPNAYGLSDADAQRAAEAIRARQQALATPATRKPASAFPRAAQRSPDRQASLARKRSVAASGALPPAMAAAFTPGEVAVLSVIALNNAAPGASNDMPIDRIAALAGVCRSTAKAAIRRAEALGHLLVIRRPRKGEKSLTNLYRVIDADWLAWLRMRLRIGGKKAPSPITVFKNKGKPLAKSKDKYPHLGAENSPFRGTTPQRRAEC